MNIFETASRQKLRFPSPRGDLNVERLWELPLTTTKSDGVSLDTVARAVNIDLRGVTEDSFVETAPNPMKATYALQLDILKHIIAVRQAENATKLAKKDAADEVARLKEILAARKDDEAKAMDSAAIEARIRVLSNAV